MNSLRVTAFDFFAVEADLAAWTRMVTPSIKQIKTAIVSLKI
jgi:hypothetical protein